PPASTEAPNHGGDTEMMRRRTGSAFLIGSLALAACGTSAPASPPASVALGLDTTFGANGILTTAVSESENDRFLAATADADGNIFAVGWALASGDSQMVLAKFKSDGTPDTTFGSDGV